MLQPRIAQITPNKEQMSDNFLISTLNVQNSQIENETVVVNGRPWG